MSALPLHLKSFYRDNETERGEAETMEESILDNDFLVGIVHRKITNLPHKEGGI